MVVDLEVLGGNHLGVPWVYREIGCRFLINYPAGLGFALTGSYVVPTGFLQFFGEELL